MPWFLRSRLGTVSRDLLTSLFVIGLVVQAVRLGSSPQSVNATPANTSPTNTTPGNASPGTLDPAAVIFTTDIGLVLHAVKPGSVADYEAAIIALQNAMSTSQDAETRKTASGWRVYKATELDAKANPLYVHMLQPALPGVDYRPSQWLDKLLTGAPAELLAKYRDAFAAPPSKLALTEFADMAVTPVNVTPPKPQQR